MRKGRLTILEEDPVIYPHTRLCPVIVGVTEAESKPQGTATLLRCTLSVVVKSLSEKCLLHKYLLCSILAKSIVQDIPTFLAHTTAL
jgi:hypothetical protein